MTQQKICKICNKEKFLSQFEFRKDKKIYRGTCLECRKMLNHLYYLKNKQEKCLNVRLYRIKYKKEISERRKINKKENPWKYILQWIKYRCNNINSKDYKYYGGRGIKCLITPDELKFLWYRDKAYLMERPSIDRINNDGNYCIDNCHFIEQSENTKKRNYSFSKHMRKQK